MEDLIKWLMESNRWKHLVLGAVYGLFAMDWYSAIYGGAGVALALEFKDGQWGGKPDYVDAALTFVGTMAGYGIHALIASWIW